MREGPILFSAPMVRALLAGTKTQTRRAMRDQVVAPGIVQIVSPGYCEIVNGHGARIPGFHCPYGKPGDRLWVRETFYAWGRWETRYSARKGRDEWHFVDMTLECGNAYAYAADGAPHDFKKGNQRSTITPAWWKRPAIHMPRRASRITLEVTGVRVERLQDISEADAIAEGIERGADFPGWYRGPLPGDSEGLAEAGRAFKVPTAFPRLAYRALWESINGPGSWDADPWVWVVAFKRVQP